MADDYNALLNRQAQARKDYSACEARIEECDYILKRLRKVKATLVEQKRVYKEIKKKDKKIIEEKYDWKGENYSDFKSDGSDLNSQNDSYYKNTLDFQLDSLNDEITRVENKKMNEMGLLGRLGSLLNSLGNEIENFFN